MGTRYPDAKGITMINVSVTAEIFGNASAEQRVPNIQLKLASEQVTLREIIERAVQEQIDNMAQSELTKVQIEKRLRNQYLNQEDIDELATDGKVSYGSATTFPATPLADTEIKKAISAFERKKFKVFIDGEEVYDLAEGRALYEGCSINFVRLIPLAGG